MWASLVLLFATVPAQVNDDGRQWPVAFGSTITIESRNSPLIIRGHAQERVIIHKTDANIVDNINATGGHWLIEESDQPSTIEMDVPQETQLTVAGALADIKIYDIAGSVVARNENNPIEIRRVQGDVTARSLLAAVNISDVIGTVNAESNMAAVNVQRVRGPVRARSAMAGVSVTESQSSDVELHATHGVVTFVGGVYAGDEVLLTTHRGPINVQLSADSNVTVEISGERRLVNIVGHAVQWDGDVALFSLGDGSGRLSIQSLSGPISLAVE